MIIKTVPGTSAFINTDKVETLQLGIAVYSTTNVPLRLKSHSMVSVKSGYTDNHPQRLHFPPVYFNCPHNSAKNKREYYAPREFPMVSSSALTRPSFPCVCQYGLKPTLFLSEDKLNRVSPVWTRARVVSDFLPLFAEQRNVNRGAKDRFSSTRRRLVSRHGLNLSTRCQNCQFVRV